MTEKYTPEKVADLIAELRKGDGNGCKHANDVMRRAADALEATEDARAMTLMFMHLARAERDEALAVIAGIRKLRSGGDEYDHEGNDLIAFALSRIPDTYGGAKPPNAEERARVRQLLSRIPEHPKEG